MKSILFLLSFVFLVSCNKEKRYSTKLMKGEVWSVTEININGAKQANVGSWNIQQGVSIYDTVPQFRWQQDTLDAQCEWQFLEKGKKFVLNYLQLCAECDGKQLDTLDYIAFNLSGPYNVVLHSRNKMSFISEQTRGNSGKIVKIILDRLK